MWVIRLCRTPPLRIKRAVTSKYWFYNLVSISLYDKPLQSHSMSNAVGHEREKGEKGEGRDGEEEGGRLETLLSTAGS